jgi:hypothetical protein
MSRALLPSVVAILTSLHAAVAGAEAVSAATRDNHHAWGWQALVLGNGLVTLAVVPAAGGRVLQYDLGHHPFLWVNPAEQGKAYAPAEDDPFHDFGGYTTWVAPQFAWKRGLGAAPPAPHLDCGQWSASIAAHDDASAVIESESPIETFPEWYAAGLQFARRYTLVRGSTRVHVEQTMRNTGKASMVVALFDDTQLLGAHEGAIDYDRFWVYYPLNHASAFGARGYMAFPGLSAGYGDGQWRSSSDDGIGAVQYLHRSGRVGADADGGWMCYVDEREGYAYAKRFTYQPGKHYPDGGTSIAVATSDRQPTLSMQVMSPMVDLAAGTAFTFVEDWYATRIDGPLLAVNDTGAVKRRMQLSAGAKAMHVEGTYGVFWEGTASLSAVDAAGGRTYLSSFYVSPIQPLVVDAEVPLPAPGAIRLVLEVLDGDGAVVGLLDSAPIMQPASTP